MEDQAVQAVGPTFWDRVLGFLSMAFTVVIAILVVAALVYIVYKFWRLAVKQLDHNYRAVLQLSLPFYSRLRVIHPGTYFQIPVLEKEIANFDVTNRYTLNLDPRNTTVEGIDVTHDGYITWEFADDDESVKAAALKGSAATLEENQALRADAQRIASRIIAGSSLDALQKSRGALDDHFRTLLESDTADYGIVISSAGFDHIEFPQEMQDRLSRIALERMEAEANTIAAESQRQIAEAFGKAAEIYKQSPIAYELFRAEQPVRIVQSATHGKVIVVVPSTMLDSGGAGAFGLLGGVVATPPNEEGPPSQEGDPTPPRRRSRRKTVEEPVASPPSDLNGYSEDLAIPE